MKKPELKKKPSAAAVGQPKSPRSAAVPAQRSIGAAAGRAWGGSDGLGEGAAGSATVDGVMARIADAPTLGDLELVLQHFAAGDNLWIQDFARGPHVATLGLLTHRASQPAAVQLCALQILRLALVWPDSTGIALAQENMLNHIWWGMRLCASDAMALLAVDALVALLRIDRERALAALRFVKKQCRTQALLERPLQLARSSSPTVALAAMTLLLEHERLAGADVLRNGIRRELLLLDAPSAARQQATRGPLLGAAAQALLKFLRAGGTQQKSSKLVVTVVVDDQEAMLQLEPKTALDEVARKLLKGKEDDHGVLVLGSAPQSAVWAPADLRVGPLDANGPLRFEVAPLPLRFRVEGPTLTEEDCPLDPRLDAVRALEYLAVLHFDDGQAPGGVRLKVRDGPWLDAKTRLAAQAATGATLQLRQPPADVEVEEPDSVTGTLRSRRVPLHLNVTVADFMQSLRKDMPEEMGVWLRDRVVDASGAGTDKLWLESDRSLASYGLDATHVLRLEPHPRMIEVQLPSGRRQAMSIMFSETAAEVVQKVCETAALDATKHRLASAGAQHFLFPWASLQKQGIRDGAIIEVRPLVPGWDSIWRSAGRPPFIWDDVRRESDLVWDGSAIEAGSLNAIVTHMTGPNASVNVTQMLLFTYRSFTDGPSLLRLLIQRAREVANGGDEQRLGPIRVGTVLKQWLDVDLSLEGQIVNNVALFVEQDIQPKPELRALNTTLQNALLRWIRGDVRHYKVLDAPPSPKRSKAGFHRYRDVPPVEVARQLTLMMFQQYAKIEAREFFKQPWAKEKTQHLCPNIMAMISSYNTLACRVASAVVQADTPRRRVKVLIHHLSVCQELRALQNYHALSAYVSGMGNAAVIRLKHTKEVLPKKWLKVWDDMSDLMNMKSSFKGIRDALLHGDPPKIPYLGVYLSDFTFIEDGNLDMLQRNSTELIHVAKRALAHRILSTVQQWQVIPYNFTPIVAVQQLLEGMLAMDDKVLYAESLLREPRE